MPRGEWGEGDGRKGKRGEGRDTYLKRMPCTRNLSPPATPVPFPF